MKDLHADRDKTGGLEDQESEGKDTGQRVQTSAVHRMNEFWRSNVEHGDHS